MWRQIIFFNSFIYSKYNSNLLDTDTTILASKSGSKLHITLQQPNMIHILTRSIEINLYWALYSLFRLDKSLEKCSLVLQTKYGFKFKSVKLCIFIDITSYSLSKVKSSESIGEDFFYKKIKNLERMQLSYDLVRVA